MFEIINSKAGLNPVNLSTLTPSLPPYPSPILPVSNCYRFLPFVFTRLLYHKENFSVIVSDIKTSTSCKEILMT